EYLGEGPGRGGQIGREPVEATGEPKYAPLGEPPQQPRDDQRDQREGDVPAVDGRVGEEITERNLGYDGHSTMVPSRRSTGWDPLSASRARSARRRAPPARR